jgi:uncharacterized membrane protein
MWVLWLSITAGIIFLIVMLSRNVRKNQLSPIDVLEMRYAKGEIGETEYNKKKQQLEK